MESNLRWGIVSTGRIAHQFARDFRHVPGAEIAAVASRRQADAERFAAEHGIPRAHGGYRALLEDPGVDVVYVATPHTLHAGNTIEALQAGKHVLCEKPFTVGLQEARRVFEVAGSTSAFVMEAMWTYFLPAIRTSLRWVREGRIGRVRQIRADFGYPLLPFDAQRREYAADLAGGCLLDMGIYPLAFAWLVLQRDPDEIRVVARSAPNGVEDDVQMLFDYGGNDDGCSAMLATSFRSKLPNLAWILGEEGSIAIPDFWRARECRLYQLEREVDRFDDGRDSLGFHFEAAAVNADIRAGRQQNELMPWATTLRLQDHLERVRSCFPWRSR